MIKSIEQATSVQQRRVDSGKRGYAKAVRRFLRRHFPDSFNYGQTKGSLPVARPILPEDEEKPEAA